MRVTGAELLAFMEGGWPQPEEHWFWDHESFDGDPKSDESYETDDLGPIFYQGDGDDPTKGEGWDLGALIERWRESRDFEMVTIKIPKAAWADVRELLKKHGCTVSE